MCDDIAFKGFGEGPKGYRKWTEGRSSELDDAAGVLSRVLVAGVVVGV